MPTRSRRAVPEGDALLEHVDALPAAVIELDSEGVIRTWAGAAERLFGWTADDAVGRDLDALELVHAEDIPFVDAVTEQLRFGRERHLVHRNRIRTRNGEVRHAEWTRLLLGRARSRAMLCYVLDVTAQAQAERAALAARAELDRCLQGNPDGICGLDRAWRITHWNPSAERMLDRSPSEVLGRELWDIFPELRGTAFHHAFEDALSDGHLRVVEERAPDGGTWYSVTAVPSAQGLWVYFSNVTGRRQLEQEVLALDAALNRLPTGR
ncbi:MAG TPA: PAS domain S-box protein [Myxococcaceae bacterium]|nr:PAS domain S-box protein [Myxococcaceae bacterium]